ncbi:MAG: cell division topological specificity factor MinE [Peptococcaceae bacterium]|nr:cell division topological specificity factor MinE [Peptococcaceae bacterium]
MWDVIARFFGRDTGSKMAAKERLRLVLVHDRTNISPQLMEMLKQELVQVISNYVEIDEAALEVNLESSDHQVALVANIPVLMVKRSIHPA